MMKLTNVTELKECLCCGSEHLKLVLDLGEQPLANSFTDTPDSSEDIFPLKLNICTDCTHLQLSHAVDPDLLFKNYLYVSGTSKTLRDYFDWFAGFTIEQYGSTPQTVLEIACNDGTQLDVYKKLGITTYGIDPAENLHKLSSLNHEVVCNYLTEQSIGYFADKQIDIISAQNVLAHNSYPLEFLKLCSMVMSDSTLLFVQTSQADMIKNNEFDTVYHEHISFFNVHSMQALANRAGLNLIDIKKTPIHGNSYIFVFSKTIEARATIQQMLEMERLTGLQDMNTYLTYANNCYQVVDNLKEKIKEYRAEGFVIAGYGAAAKGNTLLNFGGIQLDFIIDDNPLKQGLFAPGSHIPVVAIDMLDECDDLKVAFIPLAWNFFAEIQKNIKSKRDKEGDVFIKYFPTISIE